MAFEYVSWAYEQNVSPSGAKFVLVALGDSANADGYSFPGQKRLARMTGQSERSVREHLKSLEADGYLRRSERRRVDGSRTSDAYHLPVEKDPATGGFRRWEPTGNSCHADRQISPQSPAVSAGHEPSEDLPVEPSEKINVGRADDVVDTLVDEEHGARRGFEEERDEVVVLYNAMRGRIAASKVVGPKVESLIKGLRRRHSFEQLLELVTVALSVVREDPYWLGRRAKKGVRDGAPYGLVNLLRHVEDKANIGFDGKSNEPDCSDVEVSSTWYTDVGVVRMDSVEASKRLVHGTVLKLGKNGSHRVGDRVSLSRSQLRRQRTV